MPAKLDRSFDLETIVGRDGRDTDAAPGSGHVVKIPLPDAARGLTLNEYALLVRYLPRA